MHAANERAPSGPQYYLEPGRQRGTYTSCYLLYTGPDSGAGHGSLRPTDLDLICIGWRNRIRSGPGRALTQLAAKAGYEMTRFPS